MKKLYRFLFALHILVGVGAVCGGLAAITDPYSPMGIPTETLKHSPFDNFLMLRAVAFLHVLFFLIGLVQAILSAALLFEKRLFPANVVLKILKK